MVGDDLIYLETSGGGLCCLMSRALVVGADADIEEGVGHLGSPDNVMSVYKCVRMDKSIPTDGFSRFFR
jgi:hypothetical protein